MNLTYVQTYMLPGVISRFLTCKLNLDMPFVCILSQLVHNLHVKMFTGEVLNSKEDCGMLLELGNLFYLFLDLEKRK